LTAKEKSQKSFWLLGGSWAESGGSHRWRKWTAVQESSDRVSTDPSVAACVRGWDRGSSNTSFI